MLFDELEEVATFAVFLNDEDFVGLLLDDPIVVPDYVGVTEVTKNIHFCNNLMLFTL